jgi:hypothetical protein
LQVCQAGVGHYNGHTYTPEIHSTTLQECLESHPKVAAPTSEAPFLQRLLDFAELLMACIALPQAVLASNVKLSFGDPGTTLARLGDEVTKMLEQELSKLMSCQRKVVIFAAHEVPHNGQHNLTSIEVERADHFLFHDRSSKVAHHSMVLRELQSLAQCVEVALAPEFFGPSHLCQSSLQNTHHLRVLKS